MSAAVDHQLGSEEEEEDVPVYSPEPSDLIEPLPLYTEQHDPNAPITLEGLQNVIANPNRATEHDFNIWQRYIDGSKPGKTSSCESDATETIAVGFFSAIEQGQQDVIALLIENNLVTANITYLQRTPLLTAVQTRNVAVVQQLLEYGADPDAYSFVSPFYDRDTRHAILRTPLQLAASIGHLVLVKMLMEQYDCDDSIVAPDGQIALRLAADNGHREIVDYLPSRRGGGFRRWKFKNRKTLQRVKRSSKRIYEFVKFFVWDVEKFFLWTIPKYLIYKPIAEICSWSWKNRNAAGLWCKRQLLKTPRRLMVIGNGVFDLGKGSLKFATQKLPRWIMDTVVRLSKALWKFATQMFPAWIKETSVRSAKASWKFGTQTFPTWIKKTSVRLAKALWKFTTQTLPTWIKKIALSLWNFITIKVPKALALFGNWVFAGLKSLVLVVWNMIMRIVSLVSTVLEAILSFFQQLTLVDIWNGFCDILRAVLAFPKLLAAWISAFGKVSFKMLKSLFGEIGECLWYVVYGVLWVIVLLPKELWKILQSMGEALMRAGHEIAVFLNPKAAGLLEFEPSTSATS